MIQTVAPIKDDHRIKVLDLMRGIAVLGILCINIVGLGLPDPAYFDPSGAGGSTGWNLIVFYINSIFFEGSMRGLFSLLFGVGIILFIERKKQDGDGLKLAEIWYRRLIILILMGIVHAYLLVWPGDILFSYGMVGLLLLPFRKLKVKHLIILVVFIFGASSFFKTMESDQAKKEQKNYFIHIENYKTQKQSSYNELLDYYAWMERYAVMKPTEEKKTHRIEEMQKGYFSAVNEMAIDSYFFESEYHYRHNYFDVFSMMLLGIALYRLGIVQGKKTTRFYLILLAITYGVGIPLNYWEVNQYVKADFNLIRYYELLSTYDVGRLAMVMGHIAIINLLYAWGILKVVQKLLMNLGKMALTNYILQTVLANIIFIGFSMYGKLERYQLYYLLVNIWAIQLIFSSLWLRYFLYGPIEWLWKGLTYGKRFAFKR